MNKNLYLILLLIFFSVPVYAEYKPIPQNYSKQYCQEINKTIQSQVPYYEEEINNVISEIASEQNVYMRSYLIEDGINSILFDFYMKLIDITDKYADIKSNLPATDGYGVLQEVITPYLQDNNIKSNKINDFIHFAEMQQGKPERKYY